MIIIIQNNIIAIIQMGSFRSTKNRFHWWKNSISLASEQKQRNRDSTRDK